jgi:hypothetical protein
VPFKTCGALVGRTVNFIDTAHHTVFNGGKEGFWLSRPW